MSNNSNRVKRRPTHMFILYVVQLVLRTVIFGYSVFLLFANPSALDPISNFGFSNGFSFIDFIFIYLVADALTKCFPNAKIAMGSKKQYKPFHLPTVEMLKGTPEQIATYLKAVRHDGTLIATETLAGIKETAQYLSAEAQQLAAKTIDEAASKLDGTKIGQAVSQQQLYKQGIDTTREYRKKAEGKVPTLRDDIRSRRLRQIVPVAIFWIAFNIAISAALFAFGQLTSSVAIVWTLFYFMFDMICVVLWCPLQLLFMKNRCCTTCQIFNWDAIMTATPLLVFPSLFSVPIILLAIFVLVRWELAFVRHPERFDERTNGSLKCSNCKDKLCYFRAPLVNGAPRTIVDMIPAEFLPDVEDVTVDVSDANKKALRPEGEELDSSHTDED